MDVVAGIVLRCGALGSAVLRDAVEDAKAVLLLESLDLGQPLLSVVVHEHVLVHEDPIPKVMPALLYVEFEGLVALLEEPAQFVDQETTKIEADHALVVTGPVVPPLEYQLA